MFFLGVIVNVWRRALAAEDDHREDKYLVPILVSMGCSFLAAVTGIPGIAELPKPRALVGCIWRTSIPYRPRNHGCCAALTAVIVSIDKIRANL